MKMLSHRPWVAYAAGIGKVPVICLASFLVSAAVGLVNLGLVFHARDALAASPAAVGWISASWAFGYICGCTLLGRPLRRFAPRHVVVVSTLGLGLCFGMMPLAPTARVLFFVSLGYGWILSLFWPFIMGWISIGYEGSQLGRTMGRYNFSWCSASVAAPFVCGWLSEFDTRWPLLLASVLALAAAGLLLGASLALPRIRRDDGHLPGPDGKTALPRERRSPLRFAAWTGLTVTFFGMGVIMAVFPVSARNDSGLSMFTVGLLMLVRSLFNVAGFVVMGRSDRWHFRAAPMVVGQLLGLVGFAGLLGAAHPVRIGLFLAACGFSGAVSYSYSVFHGVSGSRHRSRAMAIHETMLSLGMVTGSAAGGMVYQGAGMRTVYVLCMVGIALALPAQILIARRGSAPAEIEA